MPSSSDSWTLPWRGLGLSSNLSAGDQPHPYRLLDEDPELFDFVEYSAPLSLAETKKHATLFPEMYRRLKEVPVLFHPVHLNLYGPELEPAQELWELDAHARAVSSAWVGNDVGWWHAGGKPFPGYLYVSPPLTNEGLQDCAAHALHVQGGLSVPLALENPAVLARRGNMHVLEFMARLQARTGLPQLLDLGHLFSYQLTSELPLEAGFEGFPFDRVIEIHIAGGVVTRRWGRRFYVDDHTQPVREELFQLLEAVLPRCTSLRAVTFEGDGHPPEVAMLTLRRLRNLLPRQEREPLRLTPTEASPPPLSHVSRPWDFFDLGYGVRHAGASDDAEGTLSEVDFRLAVLAEQLDRDFPISRLMLAGTREGLLSFTTSDEFRELFEGSGRSLGHAFLDYARRRLREHPEEGAAAAAALSFETFLPTMMMRPVPAPGPGHVGLSEDVRVGTFPADLSELVYAARSLRRHLTGRAWANGVVELSGLETLAQTARRTVSRPWRFAARRRQGGGMEVFTMPPLLAEVLRSLNQGPVLEKDLAPGLLAEAMGRGLVRRG